MTKLITTAALVLALTGAASAQVLYTDGPFQSAHGDTSKLACKYVDQDGWCIVPGANVATVPLPRPNPLKAMAKDGKKGRK